MKWHKLITAMIVGVVLLGSALVLPATAQVRGEVPGSFLIFPEFNITPPSPGVGQAVTQLRVCDVANPTVGNPNEIVYLHANFICPGVPSVSGGASNCAESDSHLRTTHHGCIIIDVAAEGPPCFKGYIIVFAENAAQQPISSNTLIGSYRISGTDGDDAEATNGIAIQSPQPPGAALGSLDPATSELVLSFSVQATADYIALPTILYSDFQAVSLTATIPGTGAPLPRRTKLTVLTPTIRSGAANPTANIGINWWNYITEVGHSINRQFVCWFEADLETISPLFTALGLGSEYGSLQVRSSRAAGYLPTIFGVIHEQGPGPTTRRMYHVGFVTSFYFPDISTAPPGP